MNRNLYENSGKLTSFGERISREINDQLTLIFDELRDYRDINYNDLALLIHSEVEKVRQDKISDVEYLANFES